MVRMSSSVASQEWPQGTLLHRKYTLRIGQEKPVLVRLSARLPPNADNPCLHGVP